MGLDIRWPIGLMFTLIGAMLSISGLLAKPESYERSLDININLIWGLVLLAFGVFMLVMAVGGKKKDGEPPKA
jgi:intracellular septation protein A